MEKITIKKRENILSSSIQKKITRPRKEDPDFGLRNANPTALPSEKNLNYTPTKIYHTSNK